MKLTETEILATPCEVHVSERGTFSVYLLGHADEENATALANADTFDEAVERAKPNVRKRKVKVNVPFFRLRGEQFEEGVATGFHAGTGNILAAERGESVQIASRGYRSDRLFKFDMPIEARTELLTLRREIAERSERVHELEKEWLIENLADPVTEAITAAVSEPEVQHA